MRRFCAFSAGLWVSLDAPYRRRRYGLFIALSPKAIRAFVALSPEAIRAFVALSPEEAIRAFVALSPEAIRAFVALSPEAIRAFVALSPKAIRAFYRPIAEGDTGSCFDYFAKLQASGTFV